MGKGELVTRAPREGEQTSLKRPQILEYFWSEQNKIHMGHDGNDVSPQKMFLLELTNAVKMRTPVVCLVSAAVDPNPGVFWLATE